jgi:hypothetical protein
MSGCSGWWCVEKNGQQNYVYDSHTQISIIPFPVIVSYLDKACEEKTCPYFQAIQQTSAVVRIYCFGTSSRSSAILRLFEVFLNTLQ